jgi:hypothetical protein
MKSKDLFKKLLITHTAKKRYLTLGGRSFFYVHSNEDLLIITNSKNKIYLVDKFLFNLIFDRYYSLKEIYRFKATYFTIPKWKSCPKKIISPYVAMIIKEADKKKAKL